MQAKIKKSNHTAIHSSPFENKKIKNNKKFNLFFVKKML